MPQETLAAKTKRRSLGVLFLVVIATLVGLSIAFYEKAFTPTVEVTLRSNSIGNQLQPDSDVKLRGLIVGAVKNVRATGGSAVVTLALEPARTKDIPRNVTAEILPKTLFGEQYVALNTPAEPAGPIEAGDVIPQDRSRGALEAQTVLGNLLPLLTAVQPAELNATLTAVATALQGRGAELGRTLVNADHYLAAINPHTRRLVDDLQKLGQVAVEYNGVAPDILATLRNLETSVRTVVQKRAALGSLLTTGSSTADVLSNFLTVNRQRLIEVTGQTNRIYGLLADYAPEYPCLFNGVDKLADLANQAVYDHAIHLSITTDASSLGKYRQGQEPTIVTGYGANCFGLPNPQKPFDYPPRYKCLNDGAPFTDECGQAQQTAAVSSNAPQEDALVNTLIAGELHTTPQRVPGGATLLAAPLLRGHRVVAR